MKKRIEELRCGDLQIDYEFQRSVRPGWVNKIATTFDINGLGVIKVSERSPGVFVIIDGQHRTLGMRKRGMENEKVLCEVFSGLTVAQEAYLFLLFNSTRFVRVYDKFKARLLAGDPVAVHIKHILSRYGLNISDQVHDGNVSAVDTLEKIYNGMLGRKKERNAEILVDTLDILHRAWGQDRHAYRRYILEAVGAFVTRYCGGFDVERLAYKLRAVNPERLETDIRTMKATMAHTSMSIAGVHILVHLYNDKMRKNRLKVPE